MRAAVEIDWVDLMTSYDWRGADWHAGLSARESMHRRLIAAATTPARSTVVAEIVDWGGLTPLPLPAVDRVLGSIPLLDLLAASGQAPPDDVYAKRIASVSKVYAMHSPSQWIIYDSRVARGLALLVLHLFGEEDLPLLLRFPQPPGRTGAPARGLPALGSDRQARRAFVYASWFSKEVAACITGGCPDPRGWDLRHVEMALFMLGDPARSQGGCSPKRSIGEIIDAIDLRLGELRAEGTILEKARRALTD